MVHLDLFMLYYDHHSRSAFDLILKSKKALGLSGMGSREVTVLVAHIATILSATER